MYHVFVELADKVAWSQHGYSKIFQLFWEFQDNAERIDESNTTMDDFIERFEKPYKPVIIRGVQNGWKAQYKWNIEVICCIIFSGKLFLKNSLLPLSILKNNLLPLSLLNK